MASDDSDNEGDDYALFGTALDPIDDEDLPRKRPVPIEEQVTTICALQMLILLFKILNIKKSSMTIK